VSEIRAWKLSPNRVILLLLQMSAPDKNGVKLPKARKAIANSRFVGFRYLLDRLILGNRPMRRWPVEELAAEKRALESLPLEDAKTEAVSMRLVVYIVQRYLPLTDSRTEAEWRELQRLIRLKIRRAIGGKDPPEPPRAVDPEFSDWMDRTLRRGKYNDAPAAETIHSDGES
jgi:hypothetical protein